MESRGKRLVSMIPKASPTKDYDDSEVPCCSLNSTGVVCEDDDGVRQEMQRMFDSDDSHEDPDYHPQADLIELRDLVRESSASTAIENNFLNFLRDWDEDDPITNADDEVQTKEGSGARAIAISLLALLIEKVFDATKSRKRWKKSDPNNWKINVAKKRRSDGLPYKSKKGIEKKAKVPKDVDCSKCFYKCNLPKNAREILCRHYWNLSYVEKKNFILSNIEIEPPKRVLAVKKSNKKPRKFTTKCFFIYDGSRQQVCQKYFCSTLAISPTVIVGAIEKRNECGLYDTNDQRGKKEPPNKTSESAVNLVKMHIESFPSMEPHYIRKTSKRLYLDASLSITKMYQLYRSKCDEENVTPVSEITYRRIFCTNYNYSFFVPKKDQCLTCSKYKKATTEEQLKIKKEYDDHLARKEACNLEKNKDKERALKEKSFYCLTFDLQAVLQIPSGLVGQLYYSRKLCVYNLCFYEAALPNNAYCFAWSEVNGKRGSSEIGSILYHYLSECVPRDVSEVCFYSDTCGGQNRNQFVAALLLFAVQNIEHLEQIEHKFLESGHSYMEVDSMHSSIESAKKNSEIYCMPDFLSIFKRARAVKSVTVDGVKHIKQPYQTREFKYNDFYDLKKLAEQTITNKSKDCNGQPVKWLKIKRMKYLKSAPTKMFFNYDMSEEFISIDVSGRNQTASHRPKRRRDKEQPHEASQVVLKKLYSKPLPITKAKKKDLLALCDKGVIPDEFHGWFSSLPAINEPDRLPEPAVDEDSSEE